MAFQVDSTLHRRRYDALRNAVDARLHSLARESGSGEVANACRFALSMKGKRVRPVLLLLSCQAVGGRISRAMDAAAAVETMHNFTLVHDDIMDNADSRRGRPTVHKEWDHNTALLAGDILLGTAYRSLLKTKTRSGAILAQLFTHGLLEVCEGQAMDIEFERQSNVRLRKYFDMIEKKTARLLSLSAELGGLIGNGTPRQVRALKLFGHYLGRAFQVQDDLLDVVADQKAFGKTIGGDIREGKKTFLLIHAYNHARGKERDLLDAVMKQQHDKRSGTLVRRVTEFYLATGAIASARTHVSRDTRKAIASLKHLPASGARSTLEWFANTLLGRNA